MTAVGQACLLIGAGLLAGCTGPFRPGDMVFLDLDCGSICDAMTRVTAEQLGVKGPPLSHVALIVQGGSRPLAIEAWPGDGVVERPLAEILARVRGGEGQRHGYWTARLRPSLSIVGEAVADTARRWRGLPYDDLFLPDEGRLYCSELVLRAYKTANAAVPFEWLPMRFGRPGTPERATWERYYRARGRSVPEGLRGVSPLGLYLQSRGLCDVTPPEPRR